MNMNTVMEQALAGLLESADEQYRAQLNTLQREHARHVATLKAAFGADDAVDVAPTRVSDGSSVAVAHD